MPAGPFCLERMTLQGFEGCFGPLVVGIDTAVGGLAGYIPVKGTRTHSRAMSVYSHASKAREWVKRSKKLMAWALTADERKATYIGTLRLDQKGLACHCVCPACGGTLQAVNAGKLPNEIIEGENLRPHFRHDNGQQKDACLIKMSQIVALQLLLREKTIVLPEHTRNFTSKGASGQIYTGTASRPSVSVPISAIHWVDEHEAKITLPDGRVVWLRLYGSPARGNAASGDAIITIKVDDPEVANWSQDKILEHVQLTGEWLCWDKHPDDDQLHEQAHQDADNQAKHWCDYLPEDLDLPEGLTPAQRSEGVLHWLIKGILGQAHSISTPGYEDTLRGWMPDNTYKTQKIYLHPAHYRISNVRMEQRLQRVIPDVICTVSLGAAPPMDLMVEVAVTHRVDDEKLLRIRELGIACLQIDTKRLSKGGRITIQELRSMVLHETDNKQWLFHPAIERSRNDAVQQLANKSIAIQRQLELQRARQHWIESLNDTQLLREYLMLLRQLWAGKDVQNSQGQAFSTQELIPTLEQRGFKRLDIEDVSGPKGLLWMLELIVRPNETIRAVDLFELAMSSGPVLQSYVTVLGTAIAEYGAFMTEQEEERMRAMRQTIKQSLHEGDLKYARMTHLDTALIALYPRLQKRLSSNKGTREQATKVRYEKQAQEREQRMLREQQAQIENEKERNHQQLQDGLNGVDAMYEWLPQSGGNHNLFAATELVNQKLQRNHPILSTAWRRILQSAWQARDAQMALSEWLKAQSPKTALDLSVRLELLQVALLIKRRHSLQLLVGRRGRPRL